MTSPRWFAVAGIALAAGCGGKVVVGVDGSGGAGATSSSASTSNATATAATGASGCTSNADCTGGVCLLATGTCAEACGGDCEGCGHGSLCNPCATSSCPTCDDCIAACVPIQPGQCDDDDPCPPGGICIFSSRTCGTPCASDADCGDFSFCDGCATSACCGCENCTAACAGGE